MSVAIDWEPSCSPRLREPARAQLATVSVLVPPAELLSPPLRLTRRGVAVVCAAVLALGLALVGVARASAPAGPPPSDAASVVTVAPGDTLWQIANRVAPNVDPREEVARLQRVNHLGTVDLVPGQQLRVP
jgi:Tfp pilus assembly protein FimV